MRILVVDNYDSFAYNLVQYVGSELTGRGGGETCADGGAAGRGADTGDDEVVVRRNDAIDAAGVRALDPDGIVVSPGPGTPRDAGVSMSVFADLSYPTLGVCLGHQALCAVHGAAVVHAPTVVHGKSSLVHHDGRGIFAGLPETFEVGRYHSLAVERADLPACLEETAWTDDESDENGVLMGVRHREKPHVGVQFHPESILTDHGPRIVHNFVEGCRSRALRPGP